MRKMKFFLSNNLWNLLGIQNILKDTKMMFLTWKQHCASVKGWIQIRFVADNSGEVTPFDWHNARMSINFKVNKTADGGNIAANDHSGIVNGSYSFFEKF